MRSENTPKKQKLLYFLLALLAAVAMWVYVDEFGNNGGVRLTDRTITDIPITYTGESRLADRGLMLLEEDTSTSLDLTFEGGRRLVSDLVREDIRITVDLDDVDRAGVQNIDYNIYFSDSKFSNDMIKDRSSNYARVNISELNRKEVEVRYELVGTLAEGFSAGEVQLSQTILEIQGQAEDIDPVSYVKVTLDIGESAEKTISLALPFQYYDAADRVVDGANIHPSVDSIQVTMPVYVTKEVDLAVAFQEAPGLRKENLDYEIKPDTIMVSGEASSLRGVETITLGEFDLMTLLEDGPTSIIYPIIIPEGCQNLSGVTRATMEIAFEDLVRTSIVTDRIEYENLSAGKTVEVLTQVLNVRIYGAREDVATVTAEQISATVDLRNYSGASGTYTVPAAVTVTTPRDVGISGTYQVQVTIREEEEEPPPLEDPAVTPDETPDDTTASAPETLPETSPEETAETQTPPEQEAAPDETIGENV